MSIMPLENLSGARAGFYSQRNVNLHFLLSYLFLVLIIVFYLYSHENGSKANSSSCRIFGKAVVEANAAHKEEKRRKRNPFNTK